MITLSEGRRTVFGANYFLGGIHSYAGGASFTVPSWVFIAVLAISLIMLAYTNRFLAYASLVRSLHARYKEHKDKVLLIWEIQISTRALDLHLGDTTNFLTWTNSENIALGGVRPIDLLDNSFGINMVEDELIRIEHGVLA